jgi:HK97 family phage major capsid protein
MDPIIEQHRERQDELVADSRTIMAAADAEKRDLTEDELDKIKANTADFEKAKRLIDVREAVVAQEDILSRPQGRVTDPDDMPVDAAEPDVEPEAEPDSKPRAKAQARPRARVIGERSRLRGDNGFRAFGDFVMAVKNAGMRGGDADGRLMAAAASTFGNESSGTDGGFAIPPDFRTAIMEKAFGEMSLISRTDQQTVSGNSLTFPADMTTPWGTGGITAYWTGESAAITQSKPVLEEVNVRLHKLAVLVPMTDELLDDAPAMGSYVSRKAAEKIDFKLSNAIAYGTGAGQPLGFMNSAALISQAAETSQVADTIVAGNVVKMLSRMPVQSRASAVWLIHPDAEPQLPLMTIANQPVYMPAGGLSQAPFGTLMGRPVIPHQVCQTVGDLGDIMLVDLGQYLTAVKAGGVRAQTSVHLWFDQDLMAFKFTVRVAGQPWWSTTTSSLNGSHTLSPFISLAARA